MELLALGVKHRAIWAQIDGAHRPTVNVEAPGPNEVREFIEAAFGPWLNDRTRAHIERQLLRGD